MIVGALPFIWGIFPKREIAIWGDPAWPGFVKGFDVSFLDLLIVALYFSTRHLRRGAIPFKIPFALYGMAVVISSFQAENTIATLYYAWQLLRIFAVYVVVARASTEPRLLVALIKGLALGLCFEAAIVGWQRFVIHYIQSPGTFAAQNQLGLAVHFAIFPFFALLLAGDRDWRAIAIPIFGIMIDVFTASRAAVGFASGGFALVFLASAIRKWTSRKARIALLGVVLIAAMSPLAIKQFDLRMDVFGAAEDGGRSALNSAAAAILADHPMGIGANNIVVFANVHGYYDRANVGSKNSGTLPHNIYWVAVAETGYFGGIALVVWLACPLLSAWSSGWRNRFDERGDLLLGLATSLLVVYIHSLYEWIFFTNAIQYLFALTLGMIAGLMEQLRRSRLDLRTPSQG
jgi:O-antigen ligase